MHERPTDVSLRVAWLAVLFCSLAAVPYAAAELEPSPVVDLLLTGGPLLAVLIWLQKDAQRNGVGAVHDWGYFLALAWPVVIPWYAFKTHGRSGWRLATGLFGLIGAPSITEMFVAFFLVFEPGT
jgi:hypothetical protein